MAKPEKCTATVKAKNGNPARPCKRYPRLGAKVCDSHGGASGQARRKAAERRVEATLMRAAQTMTVVPVGNPLEALQVFAGEVVGWKNLIAGRLQDILTTEEIRYASPAGEQLRAEVALFERALDRVTTILAAIAKLGIDERLAKITERQAERLDQLLAAVFIDLNLSEDQQREGKAHVARRIRSIG